VLRGVETGAATDPEGCNETTGGACDTAVDNGTAGGTYVGETAGPEPFAAVIPDSTSMSDVSKAIPSVGTSVMPKMAQPIQQRMVPA
jgi:hypothetical protein